MQTTNQYANDVLSNLYAIKGLAESMLSKTDSPIRQNDTAVTREDVDLTVAVRTTLSVLREIAKGR